MKIIGITGGIGSGKSYVADLFNEKGIPVYNSDLRAKEIMLSNFEVVNSIKEAFGEEAYIKGNLNKPFISDKIFNDKSLLQTINSIVHPAVAKDFKDWCLNQNTDYILKETALLFENNLQDKFDYIILISADIDTRISRVQSRDGRSEDQIRAIIDNQMGDDLKIEKSNFHIINNLKEQTLIQVNKIHQKILELPKVLTKG